MFLEVKNLTKSYGSKKVLSDINLEIRKGELVSLVGPSGVGKTTLLKIITGLEKYDSGEIIYPDTFTELEKPILVFQDYVLFPNMTVFDNIAFGLRARKYKKDYIVRRVDEMLDYFQMSDRKHCYPGQISSGQKQRTAIARALVLNPPLLMLDEPFANLDKNLKFETAGLIHRTQKEFDLTIISVTHDLKEALTISDRIGVMIDGSIAQYDRPSVIYREPAAFEIAMLLGDLNIVPAERISEFFDGSIDKNASEICVRPESVFIEKNNEGTCVIENIIFSGHYSSIQIDCGGLYLHSIDTNSSFTEGDRVNVSFKEVIKFRE